VLSSPSLQNAPQLTSTPGISNIVYQNIYTWSSNQMFMIKSNGGSGTMQNCQFNNFIGHSNAYSLDLNAYWSSMSAVDGAGITYKNLTFNNWKGTCANGASRGPIQVVCPSGVPCTGITVSDFAMWTESGSTLVNKCQNSFGTGGCLKAGSPSSYTTAQTVKATP
jgi:rhamnogalacturonan hydrolase